MARKEMKKLNEGIKVGRKPNILLNKRKVNSQKSYNSAQDIDGGDNAGIEDDILYNQNRARKEKLKRSPKSLPTKKRRF
jgi:hypothetical protein